MTIQKLENYNNKSAIQEEVMILTDTLKDVAKQLISEETFDKIVALADLSTEDNYQEL